MTQYFKSPDNIKFEILKTIYSKESVGPVEMITFKLKGPGRTSPPFYKSLYMIKREGWELVDA